jgi:hypothetical protein
MGSSSRLIAFPFKGNSMVVDNLNVRGTVGHPNKANTPTLVNPDAVLSNTITNKFSQTISR